MFSLPQAFAPFSPQQPKHTSERARAEQAHALLLELEDEQPSPLLMKLATGFPSALLCVLAAGVLAGALAGQHVVQPLHSSALQGWMQAAAPAPGRAPGASAETAPAITAVGTAPAPGGPPPLGDTRAH